VNWPKHVENDSFVDPTQRKETRFEPNLAYMLYNTFPMWRKSFEGFPQVIHGDRISKSSFSLSFDWSPRIFYEKRLVADLSISSEKEFQTFGKVRNKRH
jgi:hypothetical protein